MTMECELVTKHETNQNKRTEVLRLFVRVAGRGASGVFPSLIILLVPISSVCYPGRFTEHLPVSSVGREVTRLQKALSEETESFWERRSP